MGLFNKFKLNKVKKKKQDNINGEKQEKEANKKITMKELYENKGLDKKPAHKISSVKKDTQDKKQVIQKQSNLKPDKNVNSDKIKQGLAYRILIKPLITEKITNLGKYNKYAFAIDRKANKIMVKKAIEQIYGIRPLSVNISYVKGKKVRYANKLGKRKNWKKAVITFVKGQEIKIYEGV